MLQINDLTVTYQNMVAAVDGVSIEVADHGVVALLGANGAGKTTILRAITGLLGLHGGRITRGSITFDGKRIDTLTTTQIIRQSLSLVLEGRRLFAELTIDENLRTGSLAARNQTEVRRSYDRVMTLFPRLRERRHLPAGYLSGGEQQMLAIGRSLMANPKLLLLDEPSLGLAPLMVQNILEIIAQISASGTAVLLVEQNAVLALSIATHGYILENGRVELDQPANEMLRNESVRKFYLGLHEGEGETNYASLRQNRTQRKWT